VRRVLSKYFNYDVLYVMNITDIDDKIIKRFVCALAFILLFWYYAQRFYVLRARQNFLYEEYSLANGRNFKRVADDAVDALKIFKAKVETEVDPDKKKMLNEMVGLAFMNLIITMGLISIIFRLKRRTARSQRWKQSWLNWLGIIRALWNQRQKRSCIAQRTSSRNGWTISMVLRWTSTVFSPSWLEGRFLFLFIVFYKLRSLV
jgi:hypothetical protein